MAGAEGVIGQFAGSDIGLMGRGKGLTEAEKMVAHLPQDAQDKILFGNAHKLFRLDIKEPALV